MNKLGLVTPAVAAAALVALAAPANAQLDGGPRTDEYTAYTVDGRQLKVGVLTFEYGITDRLSVGSDPPMWAARAVVDVLVPNLHLKYNLIAHELLTVSLQAGAYYADISGEVDSVSGTVWFVPLTTWVSVPVAKKWAIHLEAAYTFVEVNGTGDATRANLEGAVATESLQIGTMLEYRVLPRLAITLRGRFQPWLAPLVLNAGQQFDAFTRADLRADLTPKKEHPYAVLASVAYLWNHFQARLGVGYGSIFLQGSNLYLPYTGVIPDASIAVLFW